MLRVLVADDDPVTVASLEGILRSGGHLVQTASDGAKALEKAGAMIPDVLLTDIEMPGLTGNQLVASVRRQPKLQETYVIVLTAHGEKSDRMKSLLSGADDFMVKPGGAAEILARLALADRVRKERKRAREAERLASVPDPRVVAAIEKDIAAVRALLEEAEKALASDDPAAARPPCRRGGAVLDGVLRVLREGAPG